MKTQELFNVYSLSIFGKTALHGKNRRTIAESKEDIPLLQESGDL
jgi:hypothetical protein